MDIKDKFNNSLGVSKSILMSAVKLGDRVVDCTMGNGNDTEFLCELVGESGKVYAFDIQEKAILNTKAKLEATGNLKRTSLIKDGHENLDKYIFENINAAVFNLGYLPGQDHYITTKCKTTLKAVEKLLRLVAKKGIIVLNIYHGHQEGKLEKNALYEFCSNLNQKEYNVFRTEFINQVNCPPELIVIEKR
ncbi:class I SAM-dependent methyltransferase [Clostridium felsineum]|uniref:class I SAM-dependent methyltransferase n=1 Tax=Clostridium felsineum TaxID=36839 RepID=UPI00098C8FAA|nr:class I SAM-dependent methyltransferase [Clostridium felsineum]URZ04275.1 hypothetical protein CLAUR_043640 [Clostridium felsineum]